MGGGGVISAVVFTILTSTLAARAVLHHAEDQKIYQVTDEQAHRKFAQNLELGAEQKFQMFMQNYGKNYTNREEYMHRLGIFAKNLIRAAEHQLLDPTAIHGVTPFSDLSEEEFEMRFLGLKSGGDGGGENPFNGVSSTAPILDVDGLPKNFDWREKGAVTEVKTQGICGACWAFSTTGVIEGANFLASGKLLELSEQQLVDCDRKCDLKDKTACDNGCNGGLMTNAYNYLIEAGGIEEEKTYPYTAVPGDCKFNPDKVVAKVENFITIPFDENQMAANLVRNGPLAIGLNAVFMQTYIGGVSCPLICSKNRLNHGVLLVGYGESGFSILRLGMKPYWIIKNSWGKYWGENGYYHLCRGIDMCGVNSMVSAVVATPVS